MSSTAPNTAFKPKKSVALSGTAAGNTAICTVGRTGNDLHYRGYDILEFAEQAEFEEIAQRKQPDLIWKECIFSYWLRNSDDYHFH